MASQDNKVAIVTGAGTGIGEAATIELYKDGYNVVLAGRRIEKLNDVIHTENKLKNVYEGHISHYLDNIDIVVVLRCNPNELKSRLNSRNYNDEKIKENLEAEALNIISDEAIEQYGEDNVFEIDTSTNEINNCAEMMVDIINGNIKSNKRIDYSETIMDWY